MDNEEKQHKSFKLINVTNIKSLDIQIYRYEHINTGAEHYHIQSDNSENVFLVALKTVPMDSKGIAHILEHTVLCGSKKYPVRDPFFMMIRRSLNTFMNAFTSSDWTAYPFASKNKKDFNNLLDVYLDAVFFARLDKRDFSQEGHRLDFSEEGNIESPLMYKGVVYNEMKGAMSSPNSQLYQAIYKYLFSPSSTYHHNSGGDPEEIVTLKYEELISFYKKFYHPSNASFITYGNIPAYEHHAKLNQNVLQFFDKCNCETHIDLTKRKSSPQVISIPYQVDLTSDMSRASYHVLAWKLGDNMNLTHAFNMHLLSYILLDNSASPLMYALEKTTLGNSPINLCGLDDSNRELVFMCGIEGADSKSYKDFESVVMDVLKNIVIHGVEYSKLEAALHQFELSQREISGNGYPYGLRLALSMIPHCIHNGNPSASLDITPLLQNLREDIKDPNFIKNLVRDNLLDNKDRILLSLNPDQNIREYKLKSDSKILSDIYSKMTKKDKLELLNSSIELKTRQEKKDSPEVLPKISMVDIPISMEYSIPAVINTKDYFYYKRPTNGILYKKIIIPLPYLSEQEIRDLWLFSQIIPELGTNKNSYLEFQAIQSQYTGGIGVYIDLNISNTGVLRANLVITGKALLSNYSKLSEYMDELRLECDLSDIDRIKEIILQISSQCEQGIVDSGHHYAMLASGAQLCPLNSIKHNMNGLAGISYLKKLKKQIQLGESISEFVESITKINDKIKKCRIRTLVVSDQKSCKNNSYSNHEYDVKRDFCYDFQKKYDASAWIINSDVNFCSYSFSTISIYHSNSSILGVISSLITNGYLHGKIREQGGAYGAGAQYDRVTGIFRMYSYRDPRMSATYQDFDSALQWLKNGVFTDDEIEEAIICQISNIDKPVDPAQDATYDYFRLLHNRPNKLIEEYRSNILSVKKSDIIKVANEYFIKENCVKSALIGEAYKDECINDGFNLMTLS